MKKESKLLLFLCTAIAVLSICIYLLLQIKDDTKKPAIPLLSYAASQIKAVTVTQGEKEITIEKEGDQYTVNSLQKRGLQINNNACASVFEAIGNVKYHDIISESKDNKGDYGLDTPTVTANVLLQTGETYTLEVGNSYYDGNGLYFSYSGDERVLGTIFNNAFDSLKQNDTDFVEKVIFPETKGSRLEDLRELTWTKDKTAYKVKQTTQENNTSFQLTSPIQIALPQEQASELFTPLLQLHATNITSLNPTKEQKKQLGFTGNNKLSYKIKENTYSLEIGNKTTIGYYVLTQTNVCYFVPTTSLQFIEHQFKENE